MRQAKHGASQLPQRLSQMDGLRGVAMLFVFMGHFAAVWHELVHPQGAAGFFLRVVDADATFGSSFFMLLSAFFVYGSRMRARKTFREFLVGRLWRLYPLYVLITGIYLTGCFLIPHMSKIPADRHNASLFVLENLLFLPGLLPVQPLIDVAWTLSFVVYFYFVEALLAWIFQFAGVSRGRRIALLSACCILWIVLCATRGWWEYRTGLFWVGMIVWEIVDEVSSKHAAWAVRITRPATVIVALGVVGRTVLMLKSPNTGIIPLTLCRTIITAITLSAFLWIAYFGPVWWKGLLSSDHLRRLGAASYSFYLTHGFAIKAFRFGVIPWLGSAAQLTVVFWIGQVVGLIASVAIAVGVHKLVEQPLANLASAYFRSPKRGIQERPIAA